MKNLNNHSASIRLKIWAAIVGVTILVLGCLWFFQVVLLDQTYMMQKKNQMLSDAKQTVKVINEIGLEDVTAIEEELKPMAFQENYYIEILNRHGFLYGDGIGVQGENSILRYSFLLRQQIVANMIESGKEYYLQDNIPSVYGDRFCVVATYQPTDGGYLVLLESALAPVHEAVGTIQTQLIFLSIVLILLATGVAFLLARSLTSPILQISKAAQKVAKGNLDVKVYAKSQDEIGKLAEDFNIMVREINKVNTLQRELVANVSHDIRTPLTMIKGYAETIKDLTGDDKPKREQQLDVIIQESNRLNVLVNDILDLSRLQAGQLPMRYSQFDLGTKVKDIMKRYDLLTTNEGFQFSLEGPDHVMVYADEVKIEQVIYNIVNNATNHTGSDKKVTVTLEDGKTWVTVKVSDTGNGIKPEDMPLIWDRYYKPYKKNDRKGMGTGLGLSIVKAILTAHQFPFGVNSVLGQGSTFWFQVKKADAAEQTALPPTKKQKKGEHSHDSI